MKGNLIYLNIVFIFFVIKKNLRLINANDVNAAFEDNEAKGDGNSRVTELSDYKFLFLYIKHLLC